MKRVLLRFAPATLLTVALAVATYPAWRVLLLGKDATIDELLQLVCSSRDRHGAR
jgi:hypothetical protein